MADGGKGLRTEIGVALISLIGVVSVAVIENWDKIFTRSSLESSPAVSAMPASVQPSLISATPTPIESLPPDPVSQNERSKI